MLLKYFQEPVYKRTGSIVPIYLSAWEEFQVLFSFLDSNNVLIFLPTQ